MLWDISQLTVIAEEKWLLSLDIWSRDFKNQDLENRWKVLDTLNPRSKYQRKNHPNHTSLMISQPAVSFTR